MKSPQRQLTEFTVLLIILGLIGCSPVPMSPGDVVPIQQTTALYIMQQCVKGASDSFMLQSPTQSMVLFAKSIDGGWAFTSLDVTAKDMIGKWKFWCGGGNMTDCVSMGQLAKYLMETSKWSAITPDQLSPELVSAITTASSLARTLRTMPALIIPAGSFDIMPEILGLKDNET